MNRYRPTELEPVPRPTLADAELLSGNVAIERSVYVSVGSVAFQFSRDDDGDFTGGAAVTVGAGTALDERWLTAARGVAVERLRAALLEAGGDESEPTETIACPDCERLLCAAELAAAYAATRTKIDCGPAHVVHYADGRRLRIGPDGAGWEQR